MTFRRSLIPASASAALALALLVPASLAAPGESPVSPLIVTGEGTFPPRDTMKPVQHKAELPLSFDIVDFPKAP